jgi:hypothetical protein
LAKWQGTLRAARAEGGEEALTSACNFLPVFRLVAFAVGRCSVSPDAGIGANVPTARHCVRPAQRDVGFV